MKHRTHHQNPIFASVLLLLFTSAVGPQSLRSRHAGTGRLAVVVDERLSALRASPDLSAKLLKRIGRGRTIAIERTAERDGITFYRVRVTKRTSGWMQKEAVVSTAVKGDDKRLLRLIEASKDFDRLVRARIFLDTFPRSHLRAQVLLVYAGTAEAAAEKLSREAAHRLDQAEMAASGAPEFSYFLNYSSLDRYNRQGVKFFLDRQQKRFHYDGRAWREIVTRYPFSAAADEARKQLRALGALRNLQN